MPSPLRSPFSADPEPEPGPSTSTPAAINHLTFPSPEPVLLTHTAPAPPRQLLKERLYVGNLHPSVDEYTLLQLFTRYGRVSKLDFLFHKTGPLKGKPRGYAFVEFAEPDDAERALAATHDKLLRGRKLTVTHAHQAPLDVLPPGTRPRRPHEAAKPTALSMLKSVGTGGRPDATEAKIAKMEAKLRQMSSTPAVPTSSTSASSSSIPLHPSLPARPKFSSASASASPAVAASSRRPSSVPAKPKAALPSLPIASPASPSTPLGTSSSLKTSVSKALAESGGVAQMTHAHVHTERKRLVGVRIVKKK